MQVNERLVTSDTVAVDDPSVQLLFSEQWPPFITHDESVKPFLGRRADYFGDLDLYLVDGAGSAVAGTWCVPLTWDGSTGGLPAGYSDALRRAVEQREAGSPPDTLVLMAMVVRPDLKKTGAAGRTIDLLKQRAHALGLRRMLAPVRPTLKHRYPLAPIDRYLRWRRADGQLLDPWLRTHERSGGTLIAPAPASQTFTGTVAEWRQWTGLALPESGSYVFPAGLDVLVVDTGSDRGTYVEPNVWVRHL